MSEDLLADLDDLGEDDEESLPQTLQLSTRKRAANEMDQDDNEDNDDNDDSDDHDEDMEGGADTETPEVILPDIKNIADVATNSRMRSILQKIDVAKAVPRREAIEGGAVEDDPEYPLIVAANNLTADIDTEMIRITKFIRDKYAPKFPELETLIVNPLDYVRTVKAIGNEMDLTQVDLQSFLPTATVMVVTVTATTSNGKPLPAAQLDTVVQACDMVAELDVGKRKILDYVESRMGFVAPNLSALVGSATAAKLMGAAGGLTALSKIPGCNIKVLGATRKVNTGLSILGQGRHAGFLSQADFILRIPSEYRNKAVQFAADKCALIARIDCARACPDGSQGKTMREEVDRKIERLQEPPPGKHTKALPVPAEGPKKRRGGRRARKQKEGMQMTELRKQQNRMSFGVAEEEIGQQFGSTKGMGLVGGAPGKIRAAVADKKVKVSFNQKKYAKFNQGSSGATSGLSSSLAFTPVQGLELENPEARNAASISSNSNAIKSSEITSDWFGSGFNRPKKL
ncbi:hypothetical protein SmJEL517_g00854 [Synchytrium microbalum]|uniref:Nop domain-containing protein n=1 Tax=Synchytrium microbalum TaxID=1806994 RepID=A0A507CD07_9FUNG|nr:uncharacterized protein SmJEL517_g00854 [Synchytrium microbalum]TPX37228.1 hypothetical protein SmJEL517_g00854 [Synchytrium microbalum]